MPPPSSSALFSSPGLTRGCGTWRMYGLAFVGSVVLLLGGSPGCSTTGNLGRGEKLYTGADLHIEHEGEIPDESDLRDQLETLIVPRPNSTVLGLFRMKLWLHNAGLFKETMGEPPVLLRTVEPDRVAARMRTLLDNKGYFQAKVTYEVLEEERTAEVRYDLAIHPPYTISSVSVRGDDSPVLAAIRGSMVDTGLKIGQQYDLGALQRERARIDSALKDQGYFSFAPGFIMFRADSSVGERKVDLVLGLSPRIPDAATRLYTINNIAVYSGYALNSDSSGIPAGDTVIVDGFQYIDLDGRFDPGVLLRSVFFVRGAPYSRHDHDRTLNRLMNLGVFKYVDVRFSKVDSTRLDAQIYLTPLLMKSLRFELQGVSKSNDLVGPVFDSSFRNRNMFRGAELFKISVEAGFEASVGGTRVGGSSYELGSRAELEFPKFIMPFVPGDFPSSYVPKTHMLLGIRLLHRLLYYQMFSLDASFGYAWKETLSKDHVFNPISITLAHLTRTTDQFKTLLTANPFLRRSIEDQFIIGQTYAFTYTNQLENDRKNHLYFRGSIDLSGSLIHVVQSLFRRDKGTPENPYTIAGAAYAEYSRFDVDVRHYYNTSDRSSSIASRLIAGIGIAHGNSSVLPYIRQFYIGGSNSVRAFDARTLGPGSYRSPDSLASRLFQDQAGDIKLEANAEYRFPIAGIVHGALFIDAGNVWILREDPDRPGGTFAWRSFLDEIAVGTGFGVRLDLSFFILRFDIAFPLRVPSLPKGERWVIREIDVGSASWRKANLVFNIALGYPY
ncbi:MAG TPA: BamA/TamA family outer membrane protein [Bacteroidota bacterium]|nr:BamA/TamA family outer membrane protein [Bacteroidota bacterium]